MQTCEAFDLDHQSFSRITWAVNSQQVQKLVEEAATATEAHKLLLIPVHMTREAIEEAIQLAKVVY